MFIGLQMSARSDADAELHLQAAAEPNLSIRHNADLPDASQLPNAATVLHQMLHQPRWFAAGPVKGDAAEAEPADDAEAVVKAETVAKDPRDEEIAQQAEQVGTISSMGECQQDCELLGQASGRHQQRLNAGRACKPAGDSTKTCTALHRLLYPAAAGY